MILCSLLGLKGYSQGFAPTSLQWNIPNLGEFYDDQLYGEMTRYMSIDMNGDGKPDLIDGADNTTGNVWMNGAQKSWKVYLNSGTGFSATGIQWNIPELGELYDEQVYGQNTRYFVIDFNGDGKPDLVDGADNSTNNIWMNGAQRYWKVFLNTGTGFSATGIQWNVPNLGELYDERIYGDLSHYSVVDFNGDGKPDLVDGEDNNANNIWLSGSQKYWKVYLNTGTGFAATSLQWNVPELGETWDQQIYGEMSRYTVADFNGDGKPDLIDGANNSTGSVWGYGTAQKYWKVYLNTGTGFAATGNNWNIPELNEINDEQTSGAMSRYVVIDFNGDHKPDLVDGANSSGNVWGYGTLQKYWKVFLNTGTGFSASGIQWHIPELDELYDERIYGESSNYGVVDFNGDGAPDLVDAQSASSSVWLNGSQRYWKVYLNTTSVGFTEFQGNSIEISAYPNPANDNVIINTNNTQFATPYKVSDNIGKIVITGELNFGHAEFSVNYLPSGIYFIQIGAGKNDVVKLVKF